MNDKELLEFAARAFDDEGIHISGDQYVRFLGEHEDQTPCFTVWNPLLNDADAFQLMVKLNIEIRFNDKSVSASSTLGAWEEDSFTHETKESTVRKMVTRAAAEIGKGM